MAKRRKLGRALAGAAEGASDVLQLLLQNKLIGDRQEAVRKMIEDSQRITEKATTDRQLLGKALEDPEQARRLSRSGMLGDFDLSGLFRTEAEQEAPVRRAIGGATDLAKLPSTEDVIGLRAAEGPIETLPGLTGLLQQRGAKETALLGELPPVSEEGYDPTQGIKTRTTTAGATRRRELSAGPIVTPLEPTPQQAGANELAQFKSGQGSEPYQVAQARGAGLTSGAQEDATMTPGRVTARVREAGRTTAAQQANQLGPFEWVRTAQGQTMFRRPQAGDVKFDETSGNAEGAIRALDTNLKMLQSLDPVLTQVPGLAGRAEGTGQQWWSRLTGENEPVVVYDAISESMLASLARANREVGNLAQLEQVRYKRLAPKVSDPLNVRQAKYAAIKFIVDRAQAGAGANDLAPFLDYMRFAQTGGQGTPPAGDATDALLDELLGAGAR